MTQCICELHIHLEYICFYPFQLGVGPTEVGKSNLKGARPYGFLLDEFVQPSYLVAKGGQKTIGNTSVKQWLAMATFTKSVMVLRNSDCAFRHSSMLQMCLVEGKGHQVL